MNLKIVFLLILLSITVRVDAHVTLLSPAGGEKFTPGQTVTISWQDAVRHDPIDWDLYWSKDGGTTWTALQEDIDLLNFTYIWVVPNIESNSVVIRIIQDNESADYEDQRYPCGVRSLECYG